MTSGTKAKNLKGGKIKLTPMDCIAKALPSLLMFVSAFAAAKILDIPPSTIYYWVNLYKEFGIKALTPKKRGRPSGRGGILEPSREKMIQEIIRTKSPCDYNIDKSVWTRKTIAEMVYSVFKIKIAPRTIGDYLARWDFTLKVPRTRAYKQDPEKISEWLTKTYPAILERAAKIGAKILWADETGFNSQAFKGRTYAPRGQRAVIKKTGSRWKMNAIAAITNEGVLRYMTYASRMTGKVFISFMRQLVRSANGTKIFFIVDNLPAHHSKIVNKWIDERSDQIEIFFLPPYCPDLNPEELLNNMCKQDMYSRSQPKTKEEYFENVRMTLKRYQTKPEMIKKLFNSESVKYARG